MHADPVYVLMGLSEVTCAKRENTAESLLRSCCLSWIFFEKYHTTVPFHGLRFSASHHWSDVSGRCPAALVVRTPIFDLGRSSPWQSFVPPPFLAAEPNSTYDQCPSHSNLFALPTHGKWNRVVGVGAMSLKRLPMLGAVRHVPAPKRSHFDQDRCAQGATSHPLALST